MAQAIVGSNPTPTAIIDKAKKVGVDESGGLVFRYGASQGESYSHRHYR